MAKAAPHDFQREATAEQVSRSEIESEEFAAFPKLPDGINIRVVGKDSLPGIYAESENTTTQHVASAKVLSIVVTETRERATKPRENQ